MCRQRQQQKKNKKETNGNDLCQGVKSKEKAAARQRENRVKKKSQNTCIYTEKQKTRDICFRGKLLLKTVVCIYIECVLLEYTVLRNTRRFAYTLHNSLLCNVKATHTHIHTPVKNTTRIQRRTYCFNKLA